MRVRERDSNTMPELEDLRRTLVTLVEQDRRRRGEEAAIRARDDQELAIARARFERVAAAWMAALAPRLDLLVELLPGADACDRTIAGGKASVSLAASVEFPVAASLTVTIAPVDRCRVARVTIEPLLIPMLQGHPQPAICEFDLEGAVTPDIDRFLDEGVMTFARAYLHVRDPASPYQAGRRARREAEGSRPPAALEDPAVLA